MPAEPDGVVFARALQSVLEQVRSERPADQPLAEQMLVEGFAAYGLTLTTEVVGALAFYVVNGP